MANFQTSQDLLKGALRQAGEVDNGNSPLHAKGLEYLNLSYLNVLAGSNEFDIDCGEPWSWAREEYPATIILKAPLETGTVTLVNGSNAGTFSDVPTRSQKGKFLKLENRAEYFLIKTHIAGSVDFTIDCEYTGESGTLNFKAIQLIYTLKESILRFVEPLRVYRQQSNSDGTGKIYSMEARSFRSYFPLIDLEQNTPTHFMILKQEDSTFKIQFNKYVSVDTKIDLDYIAIPSPLTDSSSSMPLIPPQHRPILMYMTATLLLNDKGDEKVGLMNSFTRAKLKAMIKEPAKQEQHMSANRGRIIPRRDLY